MSTLKVNLLAISVGNTRTRVGAFIDGVLTQTATFVNEKQSRILEAVKSGFEQVGRRDDAVVLMTSVNPRKADELETQISEITQRHVRRVERDIQVPIGRQLDPQTIVGEDRLLNAAAAYDVMRQACVVVDAGTAITIDFVDGTGTFHGGAIAPGAQLMLDALHHHTALLPHVEFARPDEPIGHNTQQAMQSGTFHGLRGMVHELVEKYAEQVGQYPMVIATGGDADLLFRNDELIDRVVPDLTLMGLAVTLRVAREQAKEA
ncbi:MAG: type III pantothenate kinase [Phycisphaeraceae bacterium]|nr:type III pantothenate kinase [Phycisphaeraceae bacterium]